MDANDIFVNAYVKNLNATPSSHFPSEPVDTEETFEGVSKDVLNLELILTKLNDVNSALTKFEAKSNEWHDFLIRSKNELDFDPELLKQYESDLSATLTSINKIKGLLLQINNEMTVLKDTLKQ